MQVIVVAKVYEVLSLSGMISTHTRPECLDGQSTGGMIELGQSHVVSCKEKAHNGDLDRQQTSGVALTKLTPYRAAVQHDLCNAGPCACHRLSMSAEGEVFCRYVSNPLGDVPFSTDEKQLPSTHMNKGIPALTHLENCHASVALSVNK